MSQNVGIPQTQPHQQIPVSRLPAREKAIKECSFQLPVELLRAIFEEYLRLELPVQVLLEVNRQWRAVALETQSLWRRLLLSADAIHGSLRAGSVHACATDGQTTRILKRSGIITKLEVTASANRSMEAFVCGNAAFGHLGECGMPHRSEGDKFAEFTTLIPPETNRYAVDPVRFELESVSPDRGDMATDMLHEAEAPDLYGLVSKLHKRPVFTGPYSKVYIGRYGDHKVAIKVLCVVKSDSVTDRKFRRERFIWWHLRHPNVLPLYGYFEDDDGIEVSHALVSEWAEGGNASEYLHQDLSWNQRVNLLHDVAKGLQYLHGMNPCVVHGDLKPLNVLINKDGVGQLCDFGLARLTQVKSGSGMTTTTAHTGTVRYLARELVSKKAIPTKATDMYALGCVALEFIYKTLPHSGLENPWEISRAIWERKPPAERPMHLGVVTALWDLMESCWHIDPSQRPAAERVCRYLAQNGHILSSTLEAAHRIRPERPHRPPDQPPSFTSVPVRSMSPPPSHRSQPPRTPVVSSISPQPLQGASRQIPFEASDITGSGSVKAHAPTEKDPFFRQIYCLLVESCIQLRSRVSLNLSRFQLSFRIARLRFSWGP